MGDDFSRASWGGVPRYNLMARLGGLHENSTELGKKLCAVEPLSSPTGLKKVLKKYRKKGSKNERKR